jgi:hypothetical protein
MGPDVEEVTSPFDEARLGLLEAFVSELGVTLLDVVHEYNTNTEFKRRIDIAALEMSNPASHAIH